MFRYILIIFSCLSLNSGAQINKKTEIIGHRGFRGQFPENTITGFKEAVKLGIDAIELDVVISNDSQVVVSHEPWFNYKTCTEPNAEPVKKHQQHNLNKLSYDEIKQYDCGRRGNNKFPEQAKIPEYKPLLIEVIKEIESYTKQNRLAPIFYLIEIKCGKKGDNKWHPMPDIIAKLVFKVIQSFNINERIMIQSFDVRSLQAIHKINDSLKIGLLIGNIGSVNHNIKKLGFIPYTYNPLLKLTKAKTIQNAHNKGCKLFIWTVNSEKKMKRLINMGADGLITDYPNIAIKFK